MNPDRKTLADLFARLYEMGVQSADLHGCSNVHCTECEPYEADAYDVLEALGEMMNVATPGVSMSDVLDAAKKAGVY